MLDERIRSRLEALAETGATEAVEGRAFVSLAALDSGARCGLYLHDEGAGWAMEKGGILAPFGSEKGTRAFVEVIEGPRAEFEAALDRAARDLGFEGDPLSFAFPAVELVRAVLAARTGFLCRLALLWLLPTELRELRDDIVGVAEDTSLPTELRDLARRLVVVA